MRIITVLSILLMLPFWGNTQCDPEREKLATKGNMGYQFRGQHCEGFFGTLVSANELQLVNFTKGILSYSSTETQDLELSVPVSTNGIVNVRGVGIPRGVYYQMDVALAAGQTFKWDTGPVLLKHKSTKYSRVLGLFGFTESTVARTYMPVQVKGSKQAGYYYLKLIASIPVTQLKWRVAGETTFKKVSGGRKYTAGRSITIRLPADLKPGSYKVEIQGKRKDGVKDITPRLIRIKI